MVVIVDIFCVFIALLISSCSTEDYENCYLGHLSNSKTVVVNSIQNTNGVTIDPQEVLIKHIHKNGGNHTLKFELEISEIPTSSQIYMVYPGISGSSIAKLQSFLTENILGELEHEVSFSFGFGLYYDKTFSTSISQDEAPRTPQYQFKHILDLTNNADVLRNSIKLLSNHIVDEYKAENGSPALDAVAQAALCTQQIRWLENQKKFIWMYLPSKALTTVDTKKMGIVRKFKEECQIDPTSSTVESFHDYIDLLSLHKILLNKDINIIYSRYDSTVTKTESEELFEKFYGSEFIIGIPGPGLLTKLTTLNDQQIRFELPVEDEFFDFNMTTRINENDQVVLLQSKNSHKNLHTIVYASDSISCDLNITSKKCFPSNEMKEYYIYIRNYGKVKISLSTPCDRTCIAPLENIQEISGKCEFGGVTVDREDCIPSDDFHGRKTSNFHTLLYDSCINPTDNESRICSGLGSCENGKCKCAKEMGNLLEGIITGSYCEIDYRKLRSSKNEYCGGDEIGTIQGGVCQCNDGYNGTICEQLLCPFWLNKCPTNEENKVCSNHGRCPCGKCICMEGFSGDTCDTLDPDDTCGAHFDCVSCKLFPNNQTNTDCSLCSSQGEYSINTKYLALDDYKCVRNHLDCVIFYNVEDNIILKKVTIKPVSLEDCFVKSNVAVILVGIFVGAFVLFITIAIIIMFAKYQYDKRQYLKLLRSEKEARGNMRENPLYQQNEGFVIEHPMQEDIEVTYESNIKQDELNEGDFS